MIVGVPRETFPGERRVALVPSVVPTVAKSGLDVIVEAGAGLEAGYPDAEYLFWGGLSVPAKTPHYIVDKLHDETQKALNMPAVQESLTKLGVQPRPMSVKQFDRFVRDDVAATVKLAKDAHIVPRD